MLLALTMIVSDAGGPRLSRRRRDAWKTSCPPWLRRLITVAMLGGAGAARLPVLEPFIVPVVWAAILAYVSWPAYAWLLRKLPRPRASSPRSS